MVMKPEGVDSLTDAERETIQAMDDKTLVEMWQSYKDTAAHSRMGSNYIEFTLQKRMEEKGASVLPSMTHDVKMDRAYDTDTNVLTQLREHIDPEVLDLAYTPEHTMPVPESWDMRKVNSFKRYGTEVEVIIEESRLWQPARLSLKKKK